MNESEMTWSTYTAIKGNDCKETVVKHSKLLLSKVIGKYKAHH